MPIKSSVLTVTTSPTLIATGISNSDPMQVTIRNDTGVDIFTGGPDVTVSTGIRLPTNTERTKFLSAADVWYAIVAVGTQALQVERTRS